MRTMRMMVPTARSTGLLVEQVGQEVVIYDTSSKQAHCLKGLAAFVFNHADGRLGQAELAQLAADDRGEPCSEREVADVVAQLAELGLVESPLALRDGLSRRELVRRSAFVGAATAFAAPLITSIVAPTAAMALSGIPTGCSGCGQNKDCVSNHCCQTVSGKQCNQGCCVEANNSCHLVDPNCPTATCPCTVVIAGCGAIVCPGGNKCCTSV
jgi:hypothetical protein